MDLIFTLRGYVPLAVIERDAAAADVRDLARDLGRVAGVRDATVRAAVEARIVGELREARAKLDALNKAVEALNVG